MNSPITGEPMRVVAEYATILIKGKKVKYLHYSWECTGSGHKFTDTDMDEINLENAYEALHAKDFNNAVAITIGICLLLIILAWELIRCTHNIYLH